MRKHILKYVHPFKHIELDCVVGETIFFNYITFKLSDIEYETFIYDNETNKMLPINKIIETPDDSIITHSKQDTEVLWSNLRYIGNTKLTELFGQFVSKDSTPNDSVETWFKRFLNKG